MLSDLSLSLVCVSISFLQLSRQYTMYLSGIYFCHWKQLLADDGNVLVQKTKLSRHVKQAVQWKHGENLVLLFRHCTSISVDTNSFVSFWKKSLVLSVRCLEIWFVVPPSSGLYVPLWSWGYKHESFKWSSLVTGFSCRVIVKIVDRCTVCRFNLLEILG